MYADREILFSSRNQSGCWIPCRLVCCGGHTKGVVMRGTVPIDLNPDLHGDQIAANTHVPETFFGVSLDARWGCEVFPWCAIRRKTPDRAMNALGQQAIPPLMVDVLEPYIYIYINISVAAENVKTCPSRDGCRHSGIKFRVARWFQSNFSLQTPPDIQVVVYIEIR